MYLLTEILVIILLYEMGFEYAKTMRTAMNETSTGINNSTDPILSRLIKGRIIKLILLHSPIAASGVAAIASAPSSLTIPEYQKPQIS